MTTQHYTSRIEALFGILGDILLQQKKPEEMLLRLAAHAISAGTGLGLNRVLIFMKDNGRLKLRVALGHIRQREAEQDWKQTADLFPTIQDLIQHVLSGNWVETPLAQELGALTLPLTLSDCPLERALLEAYHSGLACCIKANELPTAPSSRLFKILQPNTDCAMIPLGIDTGVIYVDNKFSNKPISGELLTVLQTFVRQVTMAMENTRAFDQKQREVLSLSHLLRIVQETSRQGTLQTLMDTIARKACELVNADSAVIYSFNSPLLDDDIVAQYPPDIVTASMEHLRDSGEMRRWVIGSGLRVVNDLDNPDSFTPEGLEMIRGSRFIEEHQVKCFIGLRLGEPENIIGVLYVNWRRANAVDAHIREMLQVYTEFAAQAIKSAYYTKKLRERHDDIHALMSAAPRSEDQEMARAEDEIKSALRKVMFNAHTYFVLKEPDNGWRFYHFTLPNQFEVHDDMALVAPIALAFKTGTLQHGVDIPGYHAETTRSVAFPLKSQGNCVAVLYLEGRRLPYYNDPDPDFLRDFDPAIRSLERVDSARVARAQHLILQQLTNDVNSQDRLENLFASVTRAMMTHSRAVDAVSLYYIDRLTGKLRLGGLQGFHYAEQHRADWHDDDDEIRSLIDTIESIVTSKRGDDGYMLNNKVALREDFMASAVVPLDLNGRRVGCVFFNYRCAHDFSDAEENQMRALAVSAAVAIYQALLYDIAVRLSDITAKITQKIEPDEVFKALLSQVRSITRADNVAIVERVPDQEALQISAVNFQNDPATGLPFYKIDKPPDAGQPKIISTRKNKGLAGTAIDTGATLVINDTAQPGDIPYIVMNQATRSEIAVPISHNGKPNAAIVLESNSVDFFKPEDIRRVEMLASYAAIAMQNAERYKEERRRLAFNLLHDLRNSSATLPDEVDRAIEKYRTGESPVEPLENIKRHALNVSRIIRGIAYYEEREGSFDRESLPVVALLEKTLEYALYEKPAQVDLRMQYNDVRVCVLGDEMWLRHTIDNILLNAFAAIERKHAPLEAVGTVKLTLRLTADRSSVEIFITDNGDGIEKRGGTLDFIFDPGYSTSSRRRFLSGFGLSACRQIIAYHGGKLAVYSRKHRGTTFVIRLPIDSFEE